MIVLPSRNRPESLRRFFQASQPVEPGVVMLDDDNAHLYQDVALPSGWRFSIGPRAGYVALLNRAFTFFPDEPWYACWGDDVLCQPAGWDTFLAQAAGADAIAYGDDLINGERSCALPFIGGELVRRVGWLSCPAVRHLYSDTIWCDLGRRLDALRYFPEIITEHCHWSVGKQPFDQTAQERQTDQDCAAYGRFVLRELEETIARCKA